MPMVVIVYASQWNLTPQGGNPQCGLLVWEVREKQVNLELLPRVRQVRLDQDPNRLQEVGIHLLSCLLLNVLKQCLICCYKVRLSLGASWLAIYGLQSFRFFTAPCSLLSGLLHLCQLSRKKVTLHFINCCARDMTLPNTSLS